MWISLLLMSLIEIELPRPHAAQLEVLATAQRFNVVACGRRWGKTDMGMVLGCETMLDGQPVGWFAPTYKLLEEAWNRFEAIIPQKAIERLNKSERTIKLKTGGLIDFWTLKPITKDQSVAGRGRKYKRAVVDEASMAPNLKADWTQAIRPTLSDLIGDAWFMFTPRGQNYAYQLFCKGQAGDKGWASFQMPTSKNPFIAASEIDDAKRDLPTDAFEQEYLAQFLANSANPFGINAIRDCIMNGVGEQPIQWWGVDLAKSHDWTVPIGLNARGQVAGFERWQSDWRATRMRVAAMVKQTAALVDSTGVGDPIVEDLMRVCQSLQGYHFSSQSKQRLMEGLAYAIQNKRVSFPQGVIVNELESFIYEYKPSGVRYTAPEGLHDDCVCALALAVMCQQTAPAPTRLTVLATGEEPKDIFAQGYDPMDDDDMWSPM